MKYILKPDIHGGFQIILKIFQDDGIGKTNSGNNKYHVDRKLG